MAAKKTFAIDVELARGIEAAIALRPHGTYISVSEIVYRMQERDDIRAIYKRFKPTQVRSCIAVHIKRIGYKRYSGRHAKNPVYMKIDQDPLS